MEQVDEVGRYDVNKFQDRIQELWEQKGMEGYYYEFLSYARNRKELSEFFESILTEDDWRYILKGK